MVFLPLSFLSFVVGLTAEALRTPRFFVKRFCSVCGKLVLIAMIIVASWSVAFDSVRA